MSIPQIITSRGKIYRIAVVQDTREKAYKVANEFKSKGKRAIVRKIGKRGNYGIYVLKG